MRFHKKQGQAWNSDQGGNLFYFGINPWWETNIQGMYVNSN